ncbi:hypothetical protein TRFO_20847 [Tritrichomonas foetus]|uniref:Rab-GAP TBC domain-containing protein n=1 Tax=Tritrichomonas foetus TaxID=1144522 RepID=A0A1J4KG89_9EUKA|nr:hypothetical protein TRFO_20847 [Tritrichomonas foetus]|eukprot:OHT10042.1 hypothetical protein TRFO_20847 [Tritrichomonas foetus]
MTLQSDTNLRLGIIADDDNFQQGLLKLQEQNGNVVISFYPEIESPNPSIRAKRIAQIPDYVFHLCDFIMIRLNPKDKLILSLEAPRSKCQLNFTNEQDVVFFLRFVSSNVKLIHTDCNPYVYLFAPIDDDYPKIFSSTVLPQTKPHANYAVFNPNNYPSLFLQAETDQNIFSEDDFQKLIDEEGKLSSEFPLILYNKNIDKSILNKIWENLVLPNFTSMTAEQQKETREENYQSYLQIKRIWKSATSRQWHYFVDLRDLVRDIENDLEKHDFLFSHFAHPKCVQKVAFEILLTLSYWRWDTALYVNNLVEFLMPILNGFIKDATIDKILTFKDEEVSIDEIESQIFWCFFNFYEKNNLFDSVHPEKQPIMTTLLNNVGDIINNYFPDIRQILDQKHVFSLDFLIEDCRTWFTQSFNKDEIQKLWISCLSFPDIARFFQTFIVAIIYSLTPKIEKMCVLSTKEFESEFSKIKKDNFDLNLFLRNALEIQEIMMTPPKNAL